MNHEDYLSEFKEGDALVQLTFDNAAECPVVVRISPRTPKDLAVRLLREIASMAEDNWDERLVVKK